VSTGRAPRSPLTSPPLSPRPRSSLAMRGSPSADFRGLVVARHRDDSRGWPDAPAPGADRSSVGRSAHGAATTASLESRKRIPRGAAQQLGTGRRAALGRQAQDSVCNLTAEHRDLVAAARGPRSSLIGHEAAPEPGTARCSATRWRSTTKARPVTTPPPGHARDNPQVNHHHRVFESHRAGPGLRASRGPPSTELGRI